MSTTLEAPPKQVAPEGKPFLMRVKAGKHCERKDGGGDLAPGAPVPEMYHFKEGTYFYSAFDNSLDMPEKYERVSNEPPVAANASYVGGTVTAATERVPTPTIPAMTAPPVPVDLAGSGWTEVTKDFSKAATAEVSVWKKGKDFIVVDPEDNRMLHASNLSKAGAVKFILKEVLS